MIDNRYALLFIRGERPVIDLKYNILNHPNIKRTSDGGSELYEHGVLRGYELDISDITLLEGADYQLFDGDELEQYLIEKEEKEKKK